MEKSFNSKTQKELTEMNHVQIFPHDKQNLLM